ncbi:enoyl-CoA hydratase-related protein [Rhodococcus olei]|uniref:Enoyl-CoA hydratase-related protein n=1 Tax=Rhodococcus olei TaxID=2161675 RepID=A0ABP8P8B4_9NOCA
MSTVIRHRPSPDVLVATLNRPDRLNALNPELVGDLHALLDDLERDTSCRVVVLTGAGRGFCSGLDLSEPAAAPVAASLSGPAAGMRTQEFIASLVPRIQRLPQPVIAAVGGAAYGGGMALAAACDLRIASESAHFGVQFVKLGLSGCDIGISYTLPRIVGSARAAELIMTARRVDAAEAERIGLVSRVVPDDDLLDTALDLAETLCEHSPFGLEMTKQVLTANRDAPNVDAAIALENRTQILAGTGGDDFAEAVAAFREKRRPRWSAPRRTEGAR